MTHDPGDNMIDTHWQALLDATRALHRDVPELAAFCDFPDTVTPQAYAAKHDPLCDAMLGQTGLTTLPALQAFHDSALTAARSAHWRDTYRDTPFGETLHAHFGSFEVVGRDTVLSAEGMRSFFVYQAPGFHYPMHHHPAEEIYLVLAGSGEFHLQGNGSRVLGPGAIVHHPVNAPHALTTHAAPLVAYVIWKGDIQKKPVWTETDALA